VAVEHDAQWARRISAEAPANASVQHVPLDDGGEYARNALAHGTLFDVVVIDGRDRIRCVPTAVQALRPAGVIVFDNTDRPQYLEGDRALSGAGFRRIDFVGMAPVIDYKTQTSVYYRPDNCLGI
jgi:predicted O-methyltransferase YrrM